MQYNPSVNTISLFSLFSTQFEEYLNTKKYYSIHFLYGNKIKLVNYIQFSSLSTSLQ